jgi:hypothetical protein
MGLLGKQHCAEAITRLKKQTRLPCSLRSSELMPSYQPAMKALTRFSIGMLAAALLVVLFSKSVWADELPKFSDVEVNQFVSEYADLVTKYIQAYQAAKAGNLSQFTQVRAQVKQLQDQVTKVAEKLRSRPEETQRYEQFIADYTEKMIDATK